MEKKTCFITGANSGIGKETAKLLVKDGWHVLVGSRNKDRGLKAIEEIKKETDSKALELIEIDLASKNSIIEAATYIKKSHTKLDVLIHNAADFDLSRQKPHISPDGIETIWATNHIGPVLLTNQLLDLLKKSEQGRIITVSSKGLVLQGRLKVDLTDPEFKKRKFSVPKAYYQSKLAQVMYTYWLSNELKDTNVTVNCVRVSNVKVDINRYPDISRLMKVLYTLKSKFAISAREMAKTYTYLSTSEELSNTTGKYFSEKNKMVDSSAYSKDPNNIEQVMRLTMTYLDQAEKEAS